MPGPHAFNRSCTAYRRSSDAISTGGIEVRDIVVLRDFRANVQANNPPRSGSMDFGTTQIQCTHHIYTMQDATELRKGDWVKDNESKKDFVIIFVDNPAGMNRLWRIDAWEKG